MTYEVTIFDCGREVGTFDVEVPIVEIGAVIDGMRITNIRRHDTAAAILDIDIEYC